MGRLSLLLILSLVGLLARAMPPIGRVYPHCRCVVLESRPVPPHLLKSLKIFSPDTHCPHTELIAGLTDGERVCLDPQSSWVQRLVGFILQQQNLPPEGLQDRRQ